MSVVPARVSTAAIAHHDSTGICARSSELTRLLSAGDFDLDTGIALHQRDIAERVGGGLGEIGIMLLDRLAAGRRLSCMTSTVSAVNADAQHDQRHSQPPVQDQRRRQQYGDEDEGGEMLAEKRHPQPPQRVGAGEHHFHLPAGMFAGMVGERQLQHVLEIIREHHVAALMRQPVGEPCDQRAGADDEQAEATQVPISGASALDRGPDAFRQCAGQRVDDAAEQHRFDELRAASAILAAASITARRASERNRPSTRR